MALVEPITPFAETQPCRPRVGDVGRADLAVDCGDRLPPFDESSRGRTRDHRHASDFVFRRNSNEREGARGSAPLRAFGRIVLKGLPRPLAREAARRAITANQLLAA